VTEPLGGAPGLDALEDFVDLRAVEVQMRFCSGSGPDGRLLWPGKKAPANLGEGPDYCRQPCPCSPSLRIGGRVGAPFDPRPRLCLTWVG
jgi:hypothetical protein